MKTKNHYLHELQKLLIWADNTNEAQDVLHDCNEYFEVGLENGKSEEDIYDSLGTPDSFIQKLNLNKKWGQSIKIKTLWVLLLPLLYAILLKFISSNIIFRNINFINSVSIFSIVTILLISICGWILLGKNSFHISYPFPIDRHITKSPIIYHSFLVLLQILTISLLTISFSTPPIYSYIGLYLSYAFYIIIFIVYILLLKSIYNFRLHSANYYSVYIHSVGTIISLLYTLYWMRGLNTISLIPSYLTKWGIIYIFTLIITVCFDIYIRKHNSNHEVICNG